MAALAALVPPPPQAPERPEVAMTPSSTMASVGEPDTASVVTDSSAAEDTESRKARLELLLGMRAPLHQAGASGPLAAVDAEIAKLKRQIIEAQEAQDRLSNLHAAMQRARGKLERLKAAQKEAHDQLLAATEAVSAQEQHLLAMDIELKMLEAGQSKALAESAEPLALAPDIEAPMAQLQEVIRALRAGAVAPQQAVPALEGVWGMVRQAYDGTRRAAAAASAPAAPALAPAAGVPGSLALAGGHVGSSTAAAAGAAAAIAGLVLQTPLRRCQGKVYQETPQLVPPPPVAPDPMDADEEETPVPANGVWA